MGLHRVAQLARHSVGQCSTMSVRYSSACTRSKAHHGIGHAWTRIDMGYGAVWRKYSTTYLADKVLPAADELLKDAEGLHVTMFHASLFVLFFLQSPDLSPPSLQVHIPASHTSSRPEPKVYSYPARLIPSRPSDHLSLKLETGFVVSFLGIKFRTKRQSFRLGMTQHGQEHLRSLPKFIFRPRTGRAHTMLDRRGHRPLTGHQQCLTNGLSACTSRSRYQLEATAFSGFGQSRSRR